MLANLEKVVSDIGLRIKIAEVVNFAGDKIDNPLTTYFPILVLYTDRKECCVVTKPQNVENGRPYVVLAVNVRIV